MITGRNKKVVGRGDSGNVLFLILIAVALFAALSYAVTQSTRSGGGSTEKETTALAASQITQYPTSVRTALVRMVLDGVSVSNIMFDDPGGFAGVSDKELVFHPDGGGAVYQMAPAEVMADSSEGRWYHNANFEIPQIGSSGAGGNEIIAFLPGIAQGTCQKINEKFDIAQETSEQAGCTNYSTLGVPSLASGLTEANIYMNIQDETEAGVKVDFPATDQEDLSADGCTTNPFIGKASGCFYEDDTNDEYVFYSVLMER